MYRQAAVGQGIEPSVALAVAAFLPAPNPALSYASIWRWLLGNEYPAQIAVWAPIVAGSASCQLLDQSDWPSRTATACRGNPQWNGRPTQGPVAVPVRVERRDRED